MKKKQSDKVRKERLDADMTQLETAVREMYESGRFQDYLIMISRFHNYSINNILLAFAQNPNISRLASYQTWQSLHMQVRKGEKAIKVLCPIPYQYQKEKTCIDENGKVRTDETGRPETEVIVYQGLRFRLGNVFDISQCDGQLETLVEEPQDNSLELSQAVQKLMDSDEKIMYDSALSNGSANGYFSPDSGEIHIKEGMSDLMTFRCLCHVRAHMYLPGNGQDKETERGIKEIEAEAASFLCCASLGFDQTICYSAGYLAGWSQSHSTRELLDSVGRIEKAARDILSWITSVTDLKLLTV